MMKILLLGAFMMWRTPATLELNLSSVSVDGRVPQHTTLWKGGKPLAKAFLRFIGLMLRPTLFKCPMDPTPQGIKLLQMLLVTDVGVTIWKLPFVLPCINVGSNMHHVSLYKCTTRDEAEALQKHIETSVFVPADTVGQVGPPPAWWCLRGPLPLPRGCRRRRDCVQQTRPRQATTCCRHSPAFSTFHLCR